MLMMLFTGAVVVAVASIAVAFAIAGAIAVAVAVAAAAAVAAAVAVSGIATFTTAFAVLSLMMASKTFVATLPDVTLLFTLLWSSALLAVDAALLEESQLSLVAAVFASSLTPCCLGLTMLLFDGSGDALDDVRIFFVARACQLRFAKFLICLISL
jgi:hypothetical protein